MMSKASSSELSADPQSLSELTSAKASHCMASINSQQQIPSSGKFSSSNKSCRMASVFLLDSADSSSKDLNSSFMRRYLSPAFWTLLVIWLTKTCFRVSALFRKNEIILGFYLILSLNSLYSSLASSFSMMFSIALVTELSKVSPLTMNVDVWMNWIALNRITTNWTNLTPFFYTSTVSLMVLNLKSLLQYSRKLLSASMSEKTSQNLRKCITCWQVIASSYFFSLLWFYMMKQQKNISQRSFRDFSKLTFSLYFVDLSQLSSRSSSACSSSSSFQNCSKLKQQRDALAFLFLAYNYFSCSDLVMFSVTRIYSPTLSFICSIAMYLGLVCRLTLSESILSSISLIFYERYEVGSLGSLQK